MKNVVTHFYNTLAEDFDKEQDSQQFAFVRLPEKKLIEDFIGSTDFTNKNLLEIGAGTGRFSLLFAKKAKEVCALDISENMLEKLKEKANSQGIENISCIHGDFLEVEFQEQFDCIVSFSALEYILNKEALFQKIALLLKPNGVLFITTAHNTFFRLFGRIGNYFRQKIYMTAYNKKEIQSLLEKNGLEFVSINDSVMKSPFFKGILLNVYAKKK